MDRDVTSAQDTPDATAQMTAAEHVLDSLREVFGEDHVESEQRSPAGTYIQCRVRVRMNAHEETVNVTLAR